MATQDELNKLWTLAGKLTDARKAQARSQGAYLARQKAAQDYENKSKWFGPTVSGAASGALAGFMAGGPMGAGIGALGGGAVGYLGRQHFNENPGSMQALGNTAVGIAGLSNMNNSVSKGKAGVQALQGAGGMYQEMAAGRGLGLTPAGPSLAGAIDPLEDLPLEPIPTGGKFRIGFPLETSSFDDLDQTIQTFHEYDLGGQQLQPPGELMYRRPGPAQLSATPGLFGEEDMVKASDYKKKRE